MHKNLKWKVLLILVIIGLSLWSLWPPLSIKDKAGDIIREGKINLGLDLQGGMHLPRSEMGRPPDRGTPVQTQGETRRLR